MISLFSEKNKLDMDFDFVKSTNKRLFNRLTFKNLQQQKILYIYILLD